MHPLSPETSKTVGLFGTCGGSRWREPFLALLAQHDIPAYDPQVPDWTPELAEVEAWHLANDRLILFPVTGETFGFGSLAETGFSINSALTVNQSRFVLIYIAPDVDDALKAQAPEQADASRRARKLALAHLAKVSNPNVFVATSLQDMLGKTLRLYAAIDILESIHGEPVPGSRAGLAHQAWLGGRGPATSPAP
jgi:hypothetical protein